MRPGGSGAERILRLGVDLGASRLKLIAVEDAGPTPAASLELSARGQPRAALADALGQALERLGAGTRVRVGLTGGAGGALAPALGATPVNELVAVARGAVVAVPEARTVIDLGAQLARWIRLAPRVHGGPPEVEEFATNGLCAAGSGSFLEQQADRLGLSVDELSERAAGAARGASIAGRCSVFAKSDMIHLQQKGTPTDEIAYGLCLALARTFVSTVISGRPVEPPVVLTGGGACGPGWVRALREVLELDRSGCVVPEGATRLGAWGAALLAESEAIPLSRLVSRARAAAAEALVRSQARLAPLGGHFDVALRGDEAPALPRGDGAIGAFAGVDVGSVSTNLALVDEDGRLLSGVYLPTRGQPVEVLREGLSMLRERVGTRVRVLGVGTTGSGRHLAAEVVGGDVVRNEITAQLVAAAAEVPGVDTILEIGGQDSKFISVRDGKLADFEMNKICSAGTGSFLEEQASRLGISIVGEFAEAARAGRAPVDLGSRCTVFMDTELVRAQEQGAEVGDLCAGLAYAVARNYLEKVVAGRRMGDRIVFQGGTASNDAVVAAFRALLGRPVHVHPYNRLSGAIGVGLLARDEWRERGTETRFRGFDACEDVAVTHFACGRCDNHCDVNRIRVSERVVHFGDACERFSVRDRVETVGAPRPFVELFAERDELFEAHVERAREPARGEVRPRLGLLRASLNWEWLPFWTAFLTELGYEPVIAPRTSASLLEVPVSGVPAEVCLPVKVAAAQAHALLEGGEVAQIFVPALLECPHPDDGEGHTCLYSQSLGDLLRASVGAARVVSAQFALEDGMVGLLEPTLTLSQRLERGVDEIARALNAARRAQSAFDGARRRRGREALDQGFDRAAVVLGKPYNTHDPVLNLSLARLAHRLGLPAIPWDMLPLEDVALDPRWRSVPWHYNRMQLRALQLIRRDPRLFPVLVSSYGCGPDAFVAKHVEEMLAHTPRLLLEFDEHRAEAGLQTRLEAFADEIDAHLSAAGSRRRPASRVHRAPATPGSPARPAGRRFLVPRFADHAHIYSATLRAAGHEALTLPEVDDETVRLGEEACSGRECHPHAILVGEMSRAARRRDRRPDDVFLSVSCVTPCLLRQYGDSFRIISRRAGLDLEIWDAAMRQLWEIVGTQRMLGLYEGLLAVDVLTAFATRLAPYVEAREELERLRAVTLDAMTRRVEAGEWTAPVLAESTEAMWRLARRGDPGDRPVVGVSGDLYTRVNEVGNAGLFRRLEALGCEVWPSAGFAQLTDLSTALHTPRYARRGLLSRAAGSGLTWTLTSGVRRRLVRALPAPVRELALEPGAARVLELAERFVGEDTSYLIQQIVGKLADFLDRGADGAISAAGVNCMVGTAAEAAIPEVRRAFGGAPVISLTYGGSDGPAQRIRLETFAHQVRQRAARRDEGAASHAG
jgi:predicted CoA-substrate-specific enzyme activase